MSRFADRYRTDPEWREELLARRRARYKDDESYREKQKRRAKRKTISQAAPSLKLLVHGEPVEFVPLSRAAALTGVSKKTFRVLDDTGVIPRHRFIDPTTKRRWYPLSYVEWLIPFLAEQRESRIPHWLLKERVGQAIATYNGVAIGDFRGL